MTNLVNAPNGYVQTTLEKQFSQCIRNEVEEINFWRVILDNFKDNTNKLVFADWLQDREDPRAGAFKFLVKYQTIPFMDSVSNPPWFLFKDWDCPNKCLWQSIIPTQWFGKLSKYDKHHVNRMNQNDVYCVSYKTLSGAIGDLVSSYLKLNDQEVNLVNNWERK